MAPSSTSQAEAATFCRGILPHVSRTFALTIPVLQQPLQDEVAVSYLLCRIADTIEDRADLEPGTRDALFTCFRALMEAPTSRREMERFQGLWPVYDDPHHETLMRRVDEVLTCYDAFPHPARQATRDCVTEMIDGMRTYAERDAGEAVREVCTDLDALERYCHYVAGTVGILLTRLFAREVPGWTTAGIEEQGRRFGLGLQFTNILKDHPVDRERGVSFLPPVALEKRGSSWQLTDAGRELYVGRALEHLDAGQAYLLSIPTGRPDLRLFCLWALHLAVATLRRIALAETRTKVTRDEVTRVISTTRAAVADDAELERLYAQARAQVPLR